MVYVDTTQTGRELRPGVDLWEIETSVYKKPDGKDARFEWKLKRVSCESDKLYDIVMLEGKGQEIGMGKLGWHLPPGFKGDVDPLVFVGKRVWVETGIEAFEGKNRLRVMISGLKHKGYQKLEDTPPGCQPADLSYADQSELITPF